MKFVEIILHQCCTSVRFSIQPTRTPAHDGRPMVRRLLVRRSVVSDFPAIQVRSFIHLGDAHSKQWAALNASVSIPRWRTWQHPRSTPAAYL